MFYHGMWFDMKKSPIMRFTIIFLVFILFILTAQALPWSNWFGLDNNSASQKLQEIEFKKVVLTKSIPVMKYMNSNMFDEGVDTIEISITNKGEVLKTYYIVRAENRSSTSSIIENVPNQTGVLWKFKPTIDQALDGLSLSSNGLLIIDRKEKSKLEVASGALKSLYLYYTVERENVPSLSEIIRKSSCNLCKKALSLF
jgi:hypothetical protein